MGAYVFSQHFQQARTFLENNKTRHNKFISLQQDTSSLTTVCKTNLRTQLTLLLLHAGLVQKCFLLGGGCEGTY